MAALLAETNNDLPAERVHNIDPNLMAEIYRKYQPTSIPLRIEKHLNFIDFTEDGFMLLGSSTLNGRYWTGSVHYFGEPTTDVTTNSFTGMNCQSVVTDGKFVHGKDKVVIGEDSGCISLLSLAEIDQDDADADADDNACSKGDAKKVHVIVNVTTFDHDSAVLSLSVSADKQNIVSGSMDKSIKVWDVEGLVTQYTFRPAHAHHVTSVQYSRHSNDLFASCSLDGSALLWDVRLSKPATVIKADSQEGLTSIVWDHCDDKTVAIGSNFGSVSLYDIRSTSTSSDRLLASSPCLKRPVHRLAFHPQRFLAACSDSNEVKVLNLKDTTCLQVIYKDERHENFVRGIAWHPQDSPKLYSCGWDSNVFCHSI